MFSHGDHLILYAVTYGVFLYFVSSYCLRLAFRDAVQALDQKKHRNFMRGSTLFTSFMLVSLPLFIVGMRFVH